MSWLRRRLIFVSQYILNCKAVDIANTSIAYKLADNAHHQLAVGRGSGEYTKLSSGTTCTLNKHDYIVILTSPLKVTFLQNMQFLKFRFGDVKF